jgi:exodeoxyribonuclease V gamma subunit
MKMKKDSMKFLRLHTGNRLDILARELAKVLREPLGSPFEKEVILVQSKGMERWLSLRLASELGICANCRFPFPNAFVEEIFRGLIPGVPERSVFEPDFARWRIMHILPGLLDRPGFEAIAQYLDEPGYSLKSVQLAGRIAETFDQYVIYRPDIIARWESGEEDHWQAVLWRELCRGHEKEHRAALARVLTAMTQEAPPATFKLPQRISVFGISYLPPFHMAILEHISRWTEINLFLMNPCREYWGDIASSRDARRLSAGGKPDGVSRRSLHLERGNALLASMGTLGRDFFDFLITLECEEFSRFEDPGEGSLLSCIQSDILNLRERGGIPEERTVVSRGDRSIEIHSCHSPMREVEILHDHLLRMLSEDPSLHPGEFLVMAPDIEEYAPLVQAVFDNPDREEMRIPYSIADRSMRKRSRTVDAFLALLNLWGERVTAPAVLSILESPSILGRFGLLESDLDLIFKWVQDVQIRWGIDEADRLRWNPEAFHENTWAAGIERLLLGYAMPGRGEQLFSRILPYDDVEGGDTVILGGFLECIQEVFLSLAELDLQRPLGEWADVLGRILSRLFISQEDNASELQLLRQNLESLRQMEEVSGFTGSVGIPIVRWILGKSLERQGIGYGFLTGGVTFCSMLPMRSIPFRVICLMGMNESSFPRQSKPPEFDLMAKAPRPGDRSLRNEDRYLFLEAVISAREKLFISYTGQSSRDNSIIPPSVLVSELMDAVNRDFRLPDGGGTDWILTRHRLQPFNPAYFRKDSHIFSHSVEQCAVARALAREKRPTAPFICRELSPPDEAYKDIQIEDLGRFFSNPAGFLLNKRLGMYLKEESSVLEDAECFELGSLERYSIEQDLLKLTMAGEDADALYPLLRASGRFPHGTPGEQAFKDLSTGVMDFVARAKRFIGQSALEPLQLDLSLSGFHITGAIGPIYPGWLLRYRYAGLKPKDLLKAWVFHLALNCADVAGYPKESILMGLHRKKWQGVSFKSPENPRELLGQLLEFYWQGLMRPIHFFPKTSLEYSRLIGSKGKSEEEAMKAARSIWLGNDFQRGERADLHMALCFRGTDPLDQEFRHLAVQVCGPLLSCAGEVREDG